MAASKKRIVVDTNVLISRLIAPSSVPGQAVRRATSKDQVLASNTFMLELYRVVSRPKFDRYVTDEERQLFLSGLRDVVESIAVVRIVRACRDPKDDMVLELAVNGKADLIVSGDRDLLSLGSFDGIAIVSPASYLVL